MVSAWMAGAMNNALMMSARKQPENGICLFSGCLWLGMDGVLASLKLALLIFRLRLNVCGSLKTRLMLFNKCVIKTILFFAWDKDFFGLQMGIGVAIKKALALLLVFFFKQRAGCQQHTPA